MNYSRGSGWTPLHWAAGGGNLEAVRSLIEGGADLNQRTSHYGPTAAGLDDPNEFEAMLRDAQRDWLDKITDSNVDGGATALMIAAGQGHAQVVKLLLECDANPTLEDNSHRSAQEWAEFREHPECALLIHAHLHHQARLAPVKHPFGQAARP